MVALDEVGKIDIIKIGKKSIKSLRMRNLIVIA